MTDVSSNTTSFASTETLVHMLKTKKFSCLALIVVDSFTPFSDFVPMIENKMLSYRRETALQGAL